MERGLEVFAPDGIGEIERGTDLAGLIAPHVVDGDVVVVTSKVVSKSEGRVITGDREQAVRDETVRVVARRGPTTIVETRIGVVMAAAGVDASNVASGSLVLLPADPDASARTIRERLAGTGANVAVVVSDTAGRAWRHGQSDLALGAAGILPLESFAGRTDDYGNELAVTAPAVADEVAGIAEVVSGKLGRRPVTVLRGLADRVLPVGEHGPGARSLVREAGDDMFGLGSREAVVAAVAGRDRHAFGAPALAGDLLRAIADCGLSAAPAGDDARPLLLVAAAPDDPRLVVLAFAHGWEVRAEESGESATVLAPLS